jgi:NAD(P)-dependent dehydrogenase (short-subunit alcohol dehydrogenase family)
MSDPDATHAAKGVLVTGAARGIGLATACRLANDGFRVVGCDLLEPDSDVGFEEFIKTDLTDEADVASCVHAANEATGGLVGAVNNAVVSLLSTCLEATVEEFDAAYHVNVRGGFLVSREVATLLVAAGNGGCLVNLGSVNGERGVARTGLYSSTKAAIASLTRVLAVELAPYGIRCNCVAPSPTSTPRQMAAITQDQVSERVERIPLGRFAEPEEVAAAIAFLFGADARFITGATLPVDGGYLAYGSGLATLPDAHESLDHHGGATMKA